MDPKSLEQVTVQARSDHDTASEDALIEQLGYEQQYRRAFRSLGSFAIGLTYTSPMMGLLIISYYQIVFGGYWGLTWGWIIPVVLFFPQALAVAELCSSMPTNGALYWWTAALAPPQLSRPLSFVSGWIIFMSNASAIASISYAISSSWSVLVSILHPEWNATNAEKMAIAMATIVVWGLMNVLRMEKLGIMFQVLAGLVIIMSFIFVVGIPASHAAQHKSFTPGKTVFTSYANYSEWDRPVAVPMTFFSAAFVVAGWQCPAFIVEGTRNARVSAPKAIIASFVATSVIGLLVCLVSAFCITDMEAAASDPTGFPLYTVVFESFGLQGGLAYLILIVTSIALGGSAIIFTMASQLAAFARDGGLPFSKVFAYVHPRTNMPFPSILLLSFSAFFLLIFSLSSVAGPILYSLAVIAIYMTMALPIGLRLFARERFVQGPYHFGRLSWFIHAWAFLTTLYMMVMCSFPLTPAWSPSTFNYNWCVALGAILASICLWLFYGKQSYRGVDLNALRTFHEEVRRNKAQTHLQRRSGQLSGTVELITSPEKV